MTKKTVLRVSIDPDLKMAAERILHEIGLTPSEAISIYYRRIVFEKGIPFKDKKSSGHGWDEFINATKEFSPDFMEDGRIQP